MRTPVLMAVLLLAGTGPAHAQYAAYPPPPAYDARDGYAEPYRDGEPVESVDVFVEPLSRYGRWVETRWGRAWQPAVARDWRPFTVGHWEDTPEFGRTWRSDEPWGWATYHYGRWGFDERLGWVWLPDTVWGPGWVAWREGGDYAGWAPLPPRLNVGFGVGAFADYGYDQWYAPSWVYVPRSYVYDRQVVRIVLPPSRNRDWWARTRDVTHYEREGNRVVNRSFAPDREHRGDRPGYDDRQRFGERRPDGQRPDQRQYDQRQNDQRQYGQRQNDPRQPDQRQFDQRQAPRQAYEQPRGAYDPRADQRGADPRGSYANQSGWQRPSAGPARVQIQSVPGTPPPASLNRPPDANATRPYWEQRRAQVFQPATGGGPSAAPGTPPQLPAPRDDRTEPRRDDRRREGDRREGGGDRGGFAARGLSAPMPAMARPQGIVTGAVPPAATPRPQVQAPAAAPPAAARPAPPPARVEAPRPARDEARRRDN